MSNRQMNQQDRVNQKNTQKSCAATVPAAMRRKLKELGLTAMRERAEHRAVVFDATDRAAPELPAALPARAPRRSLWTWGCPTTPTPSRAMRAVSTRPHGA